MISQRPVALRGEQMRRVEVFGNTAEGRGNWFAVSHANMWLQGSECEGRGSRF